MKNIRIIALCLTVACVTAIVWAVSPKLINMKSEYVTAGVIRDTYEFVKENQGQWPNSWSDIGSQDFSSHTRMSFHIDPSSATKEQVMSAISPQSGKYLTYPHAKADLESLFEEMQTKGISNKVLEATSL